MCTHTLHACMVDYILELQRECFAFFPQKSTNLS